MNSRKNFFKSISSHVNASDKNTAFLVVKICQFKEINMTYGFAIGDMLLEHVHNKLKLILRPTDVLGRIGNNEFGLMLPALKNTSHALLAANKIISCFNNAYTIGGASISPKVVLGIAVKPDHGDTLEKLLHAASSALQSAESNNEDYLLYRAPTEKTPPGLMVENEIQVALENDEFSLFCQPKIDLASSKLYGGESLIRWNSKKYGFVDTQYFIDILENCSSLMPVTNWALNCALRQCVRYQEIFPEFTIAVNLPPSLLINDEIVDIISNAVSIWTARPSCLILEVTEGAMMTNPKKSMEILQQLHQRGFGISIDDFGTGYSSLAYLKNLPANEIKIDKSFVMNMANDKKDANIVKAAVDLAHNLGLKIVAEGVEDEKTLDLLSAMGCDYAQGYYIAKPMPFNDLVVWMKDSTWC